jgi:hypothetical protein
MTSPNGRPALSITNHDLTKSSESNDSTSSCPFSAIRNFTTKAQGVEGQQQPCNTGSDEVLLGSEATKTTALGVNNVSNARTDASSNNKNDQRKVSTGSRVSCRGRSPTTAAGDGGGALGEKGCSHHAGQLDLALLEEATTVVTSIPVSLLRRERLPN